MTNGQLIELLVLMPKDVEVRVWQMGGAYSRPVKDAYATISEEGETDVTLEID